MPSNTHGYSKKGVTQGNQLFGQLSAKHELIWPKVVLFVIGRSLAVEKIGLLRQNRGMKILFLGDVVAKPGRKIIAEQLPALRSEWQPDVIIANGENASGGLGIDPTTAREIFKAGVDVITGGNHSWEKREFWAFLDQNQNILRPANFPEGAPGRGMVVFSPSSTSSDQVTLPKIAILNLIGRVFMTQLVDCPFRVVDRLLAELPKDVNHVFVDFHGEASSEKLAFAHYLSGRATAVVGTHTHVQTADLQVLPSGTAAITDVGMCGPFDGIIGISANLVVSKFVSGLPSKYDIAKGRR